MPPKKQDNAPKKVKPSADDKMFGMKNKKGGAAQKQLQQLKAMSNIVDFYISTLGGKAATEAAAANA